MKFVESFNLFLMGFCEKLLELINLNTRFLLEIHKLDELRTSLFEIVRKRVESSCELLHFRVILLELKNVIGDGSGVHVGRHFCFVKNIRSQARLRSNLKITFVKL
jgi:hypothetical protein